MAAKTKTIWLLVFATGAGMSLWFMTAAVLPDLVAELGLSSARQRLLSSSVQAGFVAGALVIALMGLADRFDPRRVFAACAVGTAAANAGLLVVPIDSSAAVLLRFLSGALMAGVYPVAMKIAVGWGVRDRGILVGIVVGALTFGKSLAYLLAYLGGADWRAVILIGSAVAALGGMLALLSGLGPYHARAARFRAGAMMIAWHDRDIRGAILGYLGHMWELFAFWAWVSAAAAVSYAGSMPHDAATSLGKLTAFVAIAAGAPICVIAGRYADRIGKAQVAVLAMAASATTGLLTASTFGASVPLTFALFVIWGMAVIPDSAQFSALVADYAPPEWVGSIMTLQTALGFLLTVVTVEISPIIAAALGWPVLLAGLAIGPAAGIVAMLPLLRNRRPVAGAE